MHRPGPGAAAWSHGPASTPPSRTAPRLQAQGAIDPLVLNSVFG